MLHINTDMMGAAYELLKTTPPFNRWKLPHASDVAFRVIKTPKEFGHYMMDNGRHVVAVSTAKVGNCRTLIETIAHEMIHMHDEMRGVKASHGAEFINKAALVCKHHDFDPKTF